LATESSNYFKLNAQVVFGVQYRCRKFHKDRIVWIGIVDGQKWHIILQEKGVGSARLGRGTAVPLDIYGAVKNVNFKTFSKENKLIYYFF